MNRNDLIGAVDSTPEGGTLVLPAGAHTVDLTDGPIPLPRSITIRGEGQDATVIDVVPKARVNQADLFRSDAPDGSVIALRDLRIDGPTTTGQDPLYEQGAAVNWVIYKRPNSALILDRVTVTGHFTAAVYKAGGGKLSVSDCCLNAYEAPIKFYGSHNERGRLDVSRSVLTGFGSKTTSVGIYHHAQFDVNVQGCHFEGFSRFGVYANGHPQAAWPIVTIADCTFVRCDIAQGAQLTHPVVIRATASGVSGGPGTFTKGDGTWIDSDLRSSSPFTFGQFDNPRTIRFVGCRFEPIGYGLILDGLADTVFEFTGCTFDLLPLDGDRPKDGYAFTTTATAGAVVRLNDSVIRDYHGRRRLVQVQGPITLDWGRTKIYTDMPASTGPENPVDRGVHIAANSGATIIGAPEFHPAMPL